MTFRAIVVRETPDGPAAALEQADEDLLGPGDVEIAVEYSSLNYKDGLALAGKPGVIRRHPLIAGIDAVGTVTSSDHPDWTPGDRVTVNGWGIGENHPGGLSERIRVDASWPVRLPNTISTRVAAAIGTAGFTAALAVCGLERGGVSTESGPILVTGAAGGLGSIAIALLAARGFTVIASTGRTTEHDYLRRLGAAEVIDRAELAQVGKPLQSQRFAGVIDSVGSTTLASAIAQTNYGGVVASCGLAGGADLPTTVMPFILRAVSLVGINSVFAPADRRAEAWDMLDTHLDRNLLAEFSNQLPLEQAIGAASDILAGRIRGRTIIGIGSTQG
jgi:acrylyl-CoA reductase (NADPH)